MKEDSTIGNSLALFPQTYKSVKCQLYHHTRRFIRKMLFCLWNASGHERVSAVGNSLGKVVLEPERSWHTFLMCARGCQVTRLLGSKGFYIGADDGSCSLSLRHLLCGCLLTSVEEACLVLVYSQIRSFEQSVLHMWPQRVKCAKERISAELQMKRVPWK